MEKSIDMEIFECRQNILKALNASNLTLGIMNLLLKDIHNGLELQASQAILKEIKEEKENEKIEEKQESEQNAND